MQISKRKLVLILAAVLLIASGTPAYSQWWYTGATYQVSLPTGDTKNFAGTTSWRGVGLDFRRSLNPSTSWGLLFGWNVFHERTSETINVELDGNPGAVTGLQDRTINSFPMMLGVHKYFGQEGGSRPFVGLNAGGFVMQQRFEIGLRLVDESQWQWGGAPEIGVVVPAGYSTRVILNARYYYAFTGDSIAGEGSNQSYFTFGVGFVWEH
jgi:hypothetical protein